MTALALLLVMSCAVWSASMVFFIYAIGIAILTFDLQTLITAIILVAFANAGVFILGILND